MCGLIRKANRRFDRVLEKRRGMISIILLLLEKQRPPQLRRPLHLLCTSRQVMGPMMRAVSAFYLSRPRPSGDRPLCLATCAEGRATALAESVRSEGLRRMFEVQVERSAS
jgi:hypothetical protein